MNPLVSIIVPVYNVRPYIDRCIRSLVCQTYRNIEIIVIDDGSTDGSDEIVRKLAAKDRRIRSYHKENGGLASARNRGLSLMRGIYFSFVDSDDFVSATYVEDLIKVAIKKNSSLVVGGYTKIYPGSGAGSNKPKKGEVVTPRFYERFTHEEWAIRIAISCGKLYHRSLIDQYQVLFDETDRAMGGEDLSFSLFYTSMCDSISVSNTAGYYYYQRKGSIMSHLRSSRSYTLPYQPLLQTIRKIESAGGSVNGKDYYEWFIIRILASFISLSRKRGKENGSRLAGYIQTIMSLYLPEISDNRLLRLFPGLDVPAGQTVAVWCLLRFYKLRLLRVFLLLWCL